MPFRHIPGRGITAALPAPRRIEPQRLASYIPLPPPPPSPPPCSGPISLFAGELGAYGDPARPIVPSTHPVSANRTKSAPTRRRQCVSPLGGANRSGTVTG